MLWMLYGKVNVIKLFRGNKCWSMFYEWIWRCWKIVYYVYKSLCTYMSCDIIWDGMEPVRESLCYVLSSKPFVSRRVYSGKWSQRRWQRGTLFPFCVDDILLPWSGHTVRWRYNDNDARVVNCRIVCPRIVLSPHLYCSTFLQIAYDIYIYIICIKNRK